MSQTAVLLTVIINPTLTVFVKYRNHSSILAISAKLNQRNSYNS